MNLPRLYDQFLEITASLKSTTERCRMSSSRLRTRQLWMLQTREASVLQRLPINIAVDMANEGLIGKEKLLCACDPDS